MTAPRIFLIAAEASGDALGADLIHSLRVMAPGADLQGVGGLAMARAGVRSRVSIEGLAVLGFIDGLLAYRRVIRLAEEAASAAIAADPDVVVLIDSWGFTLRVAQRIRARASHIRLVKYVGPQVWATRPGRAATLARTVDHLICIHAFEPPFYEKFGLACTVAGHPAIGRYKPGDGRALRARLRMRPDRPFLLILPGSRRAEIRRIGPAFWKAAALLRQTMPHLGLGLVSPRDMEALSRAQAPKDIYFIPEEQKDEAFAAATVALAASGTVTTEVALQGAPVIVGYKLGWITWAVARLFLFRGKFVTLMNVAAGREVAPEFIQTRLTPQRLAQAIASLLTDPKARADQVAAQDDALNAMGRGGRPAAEIAAETVLREAAAAR